jgi:DNA-binding CsgD family transcriptional regulator
MRSGMRFGLSASEKRDVWIRWKAGQTLHEIGRAFEKPHSCIRAVLLPRGGIPPLARRRSPLALRLAEREDISRGIASGLPLREIARRLDRAASTLSREISRNGGRLTYRAHAADDHAGTRPCDRRGACCAILTIGGGTRWPELTPSGRVRQSPAASRRLKSRRVTYSY